MTTRKPVTAETIRGVAEQLAGSPLTPDQAKAQAEAWEPLMAMIATLRDLPLKDIEPPIYFAPVEDER